MEMIFLNIEDAISRPTGPILGFLVLECILFADSKNMAIEVSISIFCEQHLKF